MLTMFSCNVATKFNISFDEEANKVHQEITLIWSSFHLFVPFWRLRCFVWTSLSVVLYKVASRAEI